MTKLYVYNDGSDFISCLQLVDYQLRSKRIDETNVRWIVIGLHDALNALLIEYLRRSDGFGFFSDKFEREVGKFYEEGLDSRSERFSELTRKSFQENTAGIGKLLQRANLSSRAKIAPSNMNNLEQPSKGLTQLKRLRDSFSHPRPGLFGYYEDWLHDGIKSAIEVIDKIRGNTPKIGFLHDEQEAGILMKSIAFYFGRWSIVSDREHL